MSDPDWDTIAGQEAESRRDALTFTIDGTIANMQVQPGGPRYGECMCCRPRGHVFWYGVHLPFETQGTNGPVPAEPRDWLYQILAPYRFDGGRKVRLTLEILDAPEVPGD